MLTHGLANGPKKARVLLFFFFSGDRFEIFGFNNQTAIEALHVIDSVPARNDHGAVMLANSLRGFHKDELGFILTMSLDLSSPKRRRIWLESE